MKRLLFALSLGTAVVAAAVRAEPDDIPSLFGLGEGMKPVNTGVEEGSGLFTAAECGSCHEAAYTAWKSSGHARAFANPVFQAGFLREPSMRCVHCHAPRVEQAKEVARALPRGSFLQVRRQLLQQGGMGVDESSSAHDGVDCLTCHVRGGAVLTRRDVDAAGHVKSPAAAALPSSEFCAGCHQFRFHEYRDGKLVLTDVWTQSTWDEWRAYQASGGGGETCLDCHAPQDPHSIRGTRDLEFIRGALEVEEEKGALVLRTRGVGHHVPTGNLFRHLTVEARMDEAQPWIELAWIGRRYEPRPNKSTGQRSMVLISDTSLRPGETRRIELPVGATRFRIRYHYVSEDPVARAALTAEQAATTLFDRKRGSTRSRGP